MNLSQTIAWLREHEDVLVLTHARPDGDARRQGGGVRAR